MGVHRDAGFTLIELVIAVALIALAGGAAGTFFLGGATPAVASAARDLTAALDETRRTATAFDAATLVIVPAQTGTGYRARVYRGGPSDPVFAAQSGNDYESIAGVTETRVPLGAPAFAFRFQRSGAVVAYTNVFAGAMGAAAHVCPESGAFVMHVAARREMRDIAIPCVLPVSAVVALATSPPAAAWTPGPAPDRACPQTSICSLPVLIPGVPAACPPGTVADAAQPGLCIGVQATPQPAPTPSPCPRAFSGTAPACAGQMIEQYSAQADQAGVHTTTLFANGNICDDNGCMAVAIDWSWGCTFDARNGSSGTNGANPPFASFNPYDASAGQMLALAYHDAAQGDGSGVVSTLDTYCTGVAEPPS